MSENELRIMKLIAGAGESKALAFEALKCLKTKDIDRARELLAESHKADVEAHNIQTEIITQELNGEASDTMSLLMVHAQDHYMTSLLARDLIEAMIEINA